MTTVETSPDIAALAEALCQAQAEIKAAAKDRENPFFKSRYATLDAVWEACRGPLTSHGLSVIQAPSAEGDTVTVTTMLLHTSGQWIKSPLTLTPKDDSPQAAGSAITYARRYGLGAMVGVTAEEDDDGNAAQPQRAQEPRRRVSRASMEPGLPAVEIGDPNRPAGDPEAHREESERLFTDQGALPSTAELVAAFREGRKECPACHEPKIIKGKPEYGGGWVCWASKRNGGGCGWKCKDEEPKAAPTGPEHSAGTRDRGELASGGVGGTDAHSDLIAQERRAKLLKASKLSDTLGASEDFRRDAWNTYCPGATKDTADPAQLDELIKFLELRVKQKGAA